jgi:hypothetical protein
LDIVEYFKDDANNYFIVKNSSGTSIYFKYIPTSDSSWEKERFELFLFENPYLNAENDVFEVYEHSLGSERLGWVFPITILESNDNDFANYKNLNNYKFIAYEKLLDQNNKINLNPDAEFYSLTEIFRDSIICLLCQETIKKISNFNIENYILSFYENNYLLLNGSSKSKPIYKKDDFVKKMRLETKKRIILKKANFEISKNEFINALFKEQLLQSENYLIRFIFLYQIIEHLLETEFDKRLDKHLEDFKNNKLSKNDLKENIVNDSKDRELIKTIINPIPVSSPVRQEFIEECNYLFKTIGIETKESFADKIYDLRNLVTHNLRNVVKTQSETLSKLAEIFERIIVDILINYKSP